MLPFELITKASGCRLYKQGNMLVVKAQPNSWIPTARFVLLLMSGIPLFFGLTQLVMYWKGHEIILFVSVVFIAIGSLFGIAYWLLNKYSIKTNALPPYQFQTICSFDLKNGSLLDAAGNVLDVLENTKIEREFQLTSSSKKLVARYSNGTILLAKGNPFAGGTSSLEAVFRKEGLMI